MPFLGLLTWFLGPIGRYVGIGLIVGSLALYGVFQIRSCDRAKEELKQYQRADEVKKEDKGVEKTIEEQKKRVDQMVTSDDFDRELERLRQHGTNSH